MPIKIVAASGPKQGDRVQPFNDERYYFITRINRDRAYYRWVPGEYSPYQKWEDRFCPIELLVEKKIGNLEVWVEEEPSSKEPENKKIKGDVRPYKGTLNYNGEITIKETVAPTEAKGKQNLIIQFAEKYGVKPGVIHTYINSHPVSFGMEESRS